MYVCVCFFSPLGKCLYFSSGSEKGLCFGDKPEPLSSKVLFQWDLDTVLPFFFLPFTAFLPAIFSFSPFPLFLPHFFLPLFPFHPLHHHFAFLECLFSFCQGLCSQEVRVISPFLFCGQAPGSAQGSLLTGGPYGMSMCHSLPHPHPAPACQFGLVQGQHPTCRSIALP